MGWTTMPVEHRSFVEERDDFYSASLITNVLTYEELEPRYR